MRIIQIIILLAILFSAVSGSFQEVSSESALPLGTDGGQTITTSLSGTISRSDQHISFNQNIVFIPSGQSRGKDFFYLNRPNLIVDLEKRAVYKNTMALRTFVRELRRFINVALDESGPLIDVWYGSSQVFGHLGQPQEWINILGNVSDPGGISSLTYSLNGGPQIPLTVGTSNVRLGSPGDFNIEIAVTDLNVGDNQVFITAEDNATNESSELVSVTYVSGISWPIPYTIDWSAEIDIPSVAQIVDGLWTLEDDSIRPTIPEYDRLIAIGEMTWDDFEVVVPITIHDNPFPNTGGIGVIVRWLGHFQVGSEKPSIGWSRIGAYGYYRYRDAGNHLALRLDQSGPKTNYDVQLELGTTYLLKLRVDTIVGEDGGFYQLKVWEFGQPEPVEWSLTDQDGAGDLSAGSMLLVAHRIDASFGDVSITPNDSTTYPLTINVIGDGSVTKNPDKASYNFGEEVELTANPSANWVFDNWSGSVDELTNPLTITITGTHEITANFIARVYLPIVVKNN
jgi:hypothetical protein